MSAVKILALDARGNPFDWLDHEEAISRHARGLVQYEWGDVVCVFRGGVNALTGELSTLSTRSIICLGSGEKGAPMGLAPPLTREALFERDRRVCAYCGQQCADKLLSKDHVHPVSRGGLDVWTNVVTACKACNGRKDCKTPEEARMPLLYLPYAPNRHEHFILTNRRILADQMDFLMKKVPAHSRLRV